MSTSTIAATTQFYFGSAAAVFENVQAFKRSLFGFNVCPTRVHAPKRTRTPAQREAEGQRRGVPSAQGCALALARAAVSGLCLHDVGICLAAESRSWTLAVPAPCAYRNPNKVLLLKNITAEEFSAALVQVCLLSVLAAVCQRRVAVSTLWAGEGSLWSFLLPWAVSCRIPRQLHRNSRNQASAPAAAATAVPSRVQ